MSPVDKRFFRSNLRIGDAQMTPFTRFHDTGNRDNGLPRAVRGSCRVPSALISAVSVRAQTRRS
jgi:hypothetical protein